MAATTGFPECLRGKKTFRPPSGGRARVARSSLADPGFLPTWWVRLGSFFYSCDKDSGRNCVCTDSEHLIYNGYSCILRGSALSYRNDGGIHQRSSAVPSDRRKLHSASCARNSPSR